MGGKQRWKGYGSTRLRLKRVLHGLALAGALLVLTGYSDQDPEHRTGRGAWRFWGGNLHNTHHAEAETTLSPANVAGLKPKWVFRTGGSVSAIPTLSDGRLYVTDWGSPLGSLRSPLGGHLYAIDRASGREVWSRLIASYEPHKLYNLSRSSPAIDGDLLFLGDLLPGPVELLASLLTIDPTEAGTTMYAVRRGTGDLAWKTVIDSHPLSQVTQSPVVHDGVVYVGVSSKESAVAKAPYRCCTFRGSMVALEAATGRVLWKTYMAPDNGGRVGGFSGAAVWGSAPAIDAKRGVVYVGTGQNYDVPAALKECLRRHEGDPGAQRTECFDRLDAPDNRATSIVALDLRSGAVRWSRKLSDYSAWNFSCEPRIIPYLPSFTPNCPVPTAFDIDFAQAPMVLTTTIGGVRRDLLAVGQKSGVFWALDPDRDGAVVWSTAVGPAGLEGGMSFGAAFDGERIYTQITNLDHASFTLVAGPDRGRTVTGGIWAALDPATGAILWQTPDPSSTRPLAGFFVHPVWGANLGPGFFAAAMGPLTVANGVLYGGSLDREGHMYAFDGRTGAILWSFASGGSVMSAPSIADGVLYWGSGYWAGTNNDKLYAFGL